MLSVYLNGDNSLQLFILDPHGLGSPLGMKLSVGHHSTNDVAHTGHLRSRSKYYYLDKVLVKSLSGRIQANQLVSENGLVIVNGSGGVTARNILSEHAADDTRHTLCCRGIYGATAHMG